MAAPTPVRSCVVIVLLGLFAEARLGPAEEVVGDGRQPGADSRAFCAGDVVDSTGIRSAAWLVEPPDTVGGGRYRPFVRETASDRPAAVSL